MIPIKRPRNSELSEDQRTINIHIHSRRAVVAGVFDVIKVWAVVVTTYSGNRHNLGQATAHISYSLCSSKHTSTPASLTIINSSSTLLQLYTLYLPFFLLHHQYFL
jgi:hypothetical protein